MLSQVTAGKGTGAVIAIAASCRFGRKIVDLEYHVERKSMVGCSGAEAAGADDFFGVAIDSQVLA